VNDVADAEEQPGGVEERQGVSQGGGPHRAGQLNTRIWSEIQIIK
jgi:hypothetical protein